MLQSLGGWRLTLDIKGPAGFEDATLHFRDTVEALAVKDRHQFGFRQQLFGEFLLLEAAFFDQHGRPPLEYLVETAVAEEETHNQVIHRQKSERAHQSPG